MDWHRHHFSLSFFTFLDQCYKMKNIKNNIAIVVWIILSSIFLIWAIMFSIKTLFFWYDNTNVIIPSETDILSWIFQIWDNIDSWTLINELSSDIDKYNFIINNTNNFKTLWFSDQPAQSFWDYNLNTKALREYALSNTQKLHIPENISWWYIYIKLKKTLPTNRSIILYIQPLNTAWGLKTQKTLPTNNNNEYLFNLKDVPLVGSSISDWLNHITWKDITIWWYVWSFDWNWIEQITIARYF